MGIHCTAVGVIIIETIVCSSDGLVRQIKSVYEDMVLLIWRRCDGSND